MTMLKTFSLAVFAISVKADDDQCSLFMAPTSTTNGGDIKLAIYAGVDIPPGTVIGQPEIAIPVIDLDLHNGVPNGDIAPDFFNLQADFMWTGQTVHMHREVYPHGPGSQALMNGSGLLAAIPGLGGMGHQHKTSYANADFNHESVVDRTPLGFGPNTNQKDVHPGWGANSHFYNVTLESTKLIPQGMEILVDNLGELFEEDEEFPLKAGDYSDVDDVMVKIQAFLDEHSDSMDEKKKAKVYKYFVESVVRHGGTKSLNQSEDREDGRREILDKIVKLFPEDPSEIKQTLQTGGIFPQQFPEVKKSQAWLEANGKCMDGIYVGASTIPCAEKGAFASRNMKKGGLVSPAPLMIIPERKYLDMYTVNFRGNEGSEFPIKDTRKRDAVSQQLLLNYCFSHPSSNLLFYSYGMAVNFINHQPTGKGANAKLVWTDANYHNPELLHQTVEALKENIDGSFLRLGMDIVATRDIAAHEEIFLDYGPEWQNAWDRHSKSWDSNRKWSKEAIQMNSEFNPFFTMSEREELISKGSDDPIPESIMTNCHIAIDDEEEPSGELDGVDVYEFDERTYREGEIWVVCNIVERDTKDTDQYVYMVRLDEYGIERFVENVPHKFIKYVDKPYTSTYHAKGTFRQPIGIPDDIFPTNWYALD